MIARRTPHVIAALGLALLATTAACSGDDDSTSEADLDAVIAEVQAADLDALAARVRLSAVPCTRRAGGSPKCVILDQALDERTPVDAFEFVSCDPAWVDPARVHATFEKVVTVDPRLEVYAAFDAPDAYQPRGRFRESAAVHPATTVIVFGGRGAALVLNGPDIVALLHVCDGGPASLIPDDLEDFRIAPEA